MVAFDVLIMGAGMAGACLARQLRLQYPELSIGIVEKKTEFDYWVGESTVEYWDAYACNELKLGPYLEKNHLVKHGLRYFFDSLEKNLPVDEMSEVGRSVFCGVPARQVDRSTFDRDLCAINRAAGVDVRLGVSVQSIAFDGVHGHQVETSEGPIKCRWLVDAAGRASPIDKMLKHVRIDDPRHPVASFWARVEGAKTIDELGSDQWRRRVHYTPRFLSTNHFMYRGYWLWLIAVTDSIVSVGVVFNRELAPLKIKTADDLLTFLRTHRSMRQVLVDDSRVVDFSGVKYSTRTAAQHFSTDRWFLTGMSGTFVDALGSGGCITLALANRLIAKLIEADIAGDERTFRNRLLHYNLVMKLAYEGNIRGQDGHRNLGSFDVFHGDFVAGNGEYWNTLVPASYAREKWLLDLVDAHDEGCGCTFENLARLFLSGGDERLRIVREFASYLDERGAYYANNRGLFVSTDIPDYLFGKILCSTPELEAQASARNRSYIYRTYLERMAEIEGVSCPANSLERLLAKGNTGTLRAILGTSESATAPELL